CENSARNREQHGESQRRRSAGLVICEGTLSQRTQVAVLRIGLNLPIPNFGIELQEPVPQHVQLIATELSDLALDVFNSAHCKLQLQPTTDKHRAAGSHSANPSAKIPAFSTHTGHSHSPRSLGRGRLPPQGPMCPSPRCFSRSITST